MTAAAEPARIPIHKQAPQAYRSYQDATKVVRSAAVTAGLDRRIIELVNVRVSQLNRCAHCLDLHATAAMAQGETPQRLAVLPAWRGTELFTPLERAALTLAEIVADLSSGDLLDERYDFARQNLTPEQFAALAWVAITIDAFNRIAILSGRTVRPAAEHLDAAAGSVPATGAPMEPKVVDNPDARRFEIHDGGELAGFGEYHRHDGEIAFLHTEIDPRFKGRHLGGILARHALDEAREQGLVVLPYCPFFRTWIRRHREYADLVPEAKHAQFGL